MSARAVARLFVRNSARTETGVHQGKKWKIWRTTGAWAHSMYVLIVADPVEGPCLDWMAVPESVRKDRFWTGHCEGRLSRLKPLYRRVLEVQGFMVLPGLDAAQPSVLELQPRKRIRLRPGQKLGQRKAETDRS